MFMRKVYNEEKISHCPFCGGSATVKNEQKLPVCVKHKDVLLLDLKCACGDWLDLKEGKYGPFFVCFNCKIVSFKKGLDMNGYPLKSVEDI